MRLAEGAIASAVAAAAGGTVVDDLTLRIDATVLDLPGASLASRLQALTARPDVRYITNKISLAGKWKYDVEREFGSVSQSVFKNTTIGELFTDTYLNKTESLEAMTSSSNGSAQIIKIKVVKNEMKYDLKAFTVEAGKPVEIIFENPDFMQHNLVIAQIGALQTVGKAADKIASDPQGADKQYVPDIPEVLFSTKLVNPQQTVKLNFFAPSKEGDYPFVCTFPAKTPFATIRRIVQQHNEFFKIRPGLWALTSEKDKVLGLFTDEGTKTKEREYSHYFYQGLVAEIGNLQGFQTYVPAQDRNKPFAEQKLGNVTTITEFFEFTYPKVLRRAKTIDVTWFNDRRFPSSVFEIEHSTDIQNSLLKFVGTTRLQNEILYRCG